MNFENHPYYLENLYAQARQEFEEITEQARKDYIQAARRMRWVTYPAAAFCLAMGALNLFYVVTRMMTCN